MTVFDFIEIGTSDFDTEIQKSSNNTIGLSVEPMSYYLNRLPDKQLCTKVNVAISNYNGKIKLYSVAPDIISKYNLPHWVRGCNTVGKYHNLVLDVLKQKGLNKDELYTIDDVEVIDVSTLVKRYNITGCNYLKIDTEGHDCVILNNWLDCVEKNNEHLLPNKIMFESNTLSNNDDVLKVISRFRKFGYKIIYANYDTLLTLQ